MNLLPQSLLHSLKNINGFKEDAFVDVHKLGEQITSVIINPAKVFNLKDHFNHIEKVLWSRNGFYLDERPSFTLDPLFHAGAYNVHEASSMFLEEVMKQTCELSKPLRVLDLCAAAGGRSIIIQPIISEESLLVSNEANKTRVNILSENIAKWGGANVIVTNNDAKDFQKMNAFFDVIIVAAPNSGSGLFRKDNNSINEWSEKAVALCSLNQQKILTDILPALKPGGILIYSTYSYSQSENEDIADMLVGKLALQNISLNIDQFKEIVETVSPLQHCNGYRFYPDKLRGEGFYIAAFKKKYEEEETEVKRIKYRDIQISKSQLEIITPYIKDVVKFAFIYQKDEILAVPKAILNGLYEVQFAMYIKKAGIKIGSLIRNELIPAHDFAISTIASEKFNFVDVTLNVAQDYLRRKEIVLVTTIKGWAILRYENIPIGFVKILPGRTNNYYPKELKILNK